MRKQKLLSLFVLLMAVTGAWAQANSCGNGLTWSLTGNVLAISYDGTGTGAMNNWDDENPAPWYNDAPDVKYIEIAAGVTSIGAYAFADCDFQFIDLPASVTSIGNNAFSNMYSEGLTILSTACTLPQDLFENGNFQYIFVPATSVATYQNQYSDYDDLFVEIPSVQQTNNVILWDYNLCTSIMAGSPRDELEILNYHNTQGGITVTAEVDYMHGDVEAGFMYGGIVFECTGKLTFTSAVGNITHIEISGDTYSTLEVTGWTWTPGEGGDNGTLSWTGNAASVQLPIAQDITLENTEVVFTIGNAPAPSTYTLKLVADPEKGSVSVVVTNLLSSGIVNNSNGTYTVPANAEVTIQATPLDGYEFTGWKEGNRWCDFTECGTALNTNDNPLTFTMTADVAYKAEFAAVTPDFAGEGTEESPYQITSAEDWNLFATRVSEGNPYTGKYFQLTNDIAISTMVGTDENHAFNGIFDGAGDTITATLSSDAACCAPFAYTYGATIKNLHTSGTITTTGDNAGGVVGRNGTESLTLTNVSSDMTINSTRANGGLVGYTINASISGCAFTGKLLSESSRRIGGFVGWKSNTTGSYLTITDCVFDPEEVTNDNSSSRTFVAIGGGTVTITNCYYTQAYGTGQGKLMHAITEGTGVLVLNTGSATIYNVSGITSYGTGISYNNVLYGGNGDVISLNLSGSGTGYTASTGTLSGDANPYTLTMADADCEISRAVKFYIVGTMNGWAPNPAYKLAVNPANPSEYMILGLPLTTNSQFKVGYSDDGSSVSTWYPDQAPNYGEGGQIAYNGTYDIYFRPDGQGGNDWYYKYFYVAANTYEISMADGADNSALIGNLNTKKANVTLDGRTLYKDGSWNTLCLPFAMTAEQIEAQLAPDALMTLSSTSLDGNTLTMTFEDATAIEAGKPYVIKWAAAANLVNPVFSGVTISNTVANIETTNADFKGNYAPVVYNTENKSVLFLASDGTFRYPDGGETLTTINAFRGYFELKDIEAGSPAGAPGLRIISNLNEEATTTGVEHLGEDNKAVKVLENGVLYILRDGVRYDVMGKKVSNR